MRTETEPCTTSPGPVDMALDISVAPLLSRFDSCNQHGSRFHIQCRTDVPVGQIFILCEHLGLFSQATGACFLPLKGLGRHRLNGNSLQIEASNIDRSMAHDVKRVAVSIASSYRCINWLLTMIGSCCGRVRDWFRDADCADR